MEGPDDDGRADGADPWPILMPVLVDTNVISDLLTDDPNWRRWSQRQLEEHRSELAINAVEYAELCVPALELEEVEHLLLDLGIEVLDIPRAGLFRAAKAFVQYRANEGTKTTPLPDFFIGGHAEAAALRLITRDATRFRTYFPAVDLIAPER